MYIIHKKSDKSGVAPLRKNGRLETDPTNKPIFLNEQFQFVFSPSTNIDREEFYNQNYMADSQEDYPDSGDINITNTGMQKLLKNLNPHKAAGPDNIRLMVLKELASEISPILSIIYNVSIKAGEIPDDWRSAVITPAFKKGQKYVPAKYRPISLTGICCKVIEHIVTSHIMRHAERNNILYPLQHGFRSKRSCETQLLECIDDHTMNLENGKQTDLLILDFSKAFDKVSHSLLLHKLYHYGIRGSTNQMDSNLLI
jgi:hypothetical protein